jgi:hypothetical protein
MFGQSESPRAREAHGPYMCLPFPILLGAAASALGRVTSRAFPRDRERWGRGLQKPQRRVPSAVGRVTHTAFSRSRRRASRVLTGTEAEEPAVPRRPVGQGGAFPSPTSSPCRAKARATTRSPPAQSAGGIGQPAPRNRVARSASGGRSGASPASGLAPNAPARLGAPPGSRVPARASARPGACRAGSTAAGSGGSDRREVRAGRERFSRRARASPRSGRRQSHGRWSTPQAGALPGAAHRSGGPGRGAPNTPPIWIAVVSTWSQRFARVSERSGRAFWMKIERLRHPRPPRSGLAMAASRWRRPSSARSEASGSGSRTGDVLPTLRTAPPTAR